MKILIIEDDHIVAKPLKKFLENNGYLTEVASDGEQGLNLATYNYYDLIISDYLLPKINGKEIISRLREKNIKTPVLILSICNETKNKISFLNKGADDYLTKPFFFTELQARINSLLRRKVGSENEKLSYCDLELDLINQEAYRDGQSIYLTSKEFLLLKLLIENPEKIITRQTINEIAWSNDNDFTSNVTEAYIRKLRQKIDFKKPQLIQTISGRGYCLKK
jgi:DNA-binding response OmpR family regulator